MSEILITGACGFLGRHVARHFTRCGHIVRGLGHGHWPEAEWKNWGLAEFREADLNLETFRHYAGTPYAIVHCGGSGSVAFSVENPGEDFQRTVVATSDLLEYVRRFAPATRLVYPSSASVYGTAEVSPTPETCRHAPISPYGAHKSMAELLVATYAGNFHVSASIVRLFSVYGSELRKQLLWDACRKFAAKDPVFKGSGTEVRDWIHVDDAVELLALAVSNASPECPVVNGGSGEGVSVHALLARCAHCLCIDTNELRFSGALSPGDPDRYVADISRARNWGWTPKRQWRDGVAEYCAWWLETQASHRMAHPATVLP